MNLEAFCKDLLNELELDLSHLQKNGFNPLVLELQLDNHLTLTIKEQQVGMIVTSPLCTLDQEDLEEVYALLLEGNLFGQATGTYGVFGLTKNEKDLVLNFDLDMELNYSQFREKIEDFLNYVEYWQKKIELKLSESKTE